jgi:hypothetical protein
MAATGFVFVDDEDVVEPKDGARHGSGCHEQKLAAEGGKGPDAVKEDAVYALSRLETLPVQMDIWTTQMDWPRWSQLWCRAGAGEALLCRQRYKRLNSLTSSFSLEISTAWMMFCVTTRLWLRCGGDMHAGQAGV